MAAKEKKTSRTRVTASFEVKSAVLRRIDAIRTANQKFKSISSVLDHLRGAHSEAYKLVDNRPALTRFLKQTNVELGDLLEVRPRSPEPRPHLSREISREILALDLIAGMYVAIGGHPLDFAYRKALEAITSDDRAAAIRNLASLSSNRG